MMKKLVILTLATGLTLTLTACDFFGHKAPEQPIENAQPADNETLGNETIADPDNAAEGNDATPETNAAAGNAL